MGFGGFRMTKILVFGDSIAWGAFDTKRGGWVERLKTYLFNERPEIRGYVYNLSISSNDTRGILFELEKQIEIIEKIEPEDYILIFSIGSNDCRYIDSKKNKFVPIQEFKENLNKIIKIVNKYSKGIVFTGLMKVDEDKTLPFLGSATEKEYYANDDLKEYDKMIKDACNDYGIIFIPLLNVLNIKEDLFDGVHPNSKGHEKIFKKVLPFIEEIIKK